MIQNTPIRSCFESTRPFFSVEFFPPKNKESESQFYRTAEQYAALEPSFVTITYGAGGSTRERSLNYATYLKDSLGQQVMPHLTCVGHSRDDLAVMLQSYEEAGFRSLMALRGDPPRNQPEFKVHPDGFAYANELVAFIRQRHPGFSIGVGGYPEKHPEAPDTSSDIFNLVRKQTAGADFVTTQLFFDNADYFTWAKACRKAGLTIPILPGIMPALSLDQLTRICGFCGARIPERLKKQMEDVSGLAPDDATRIGTEWAYEQIKELIQGGAPGVHLYALNRVEAGAGIIQRLKEEGVI